MKRRINYTNRRRINKSDISIRVIRKDGEAQYFELDVGLENYDFPSKAKVYVDAYRLSEFRRFEFGTVESPKEIDKADISDLGYRDSLLFSLIIVEPITNLILGIAKQIKPEDPKRNKSILPVEYEDIRNNRIWKTKFDEGGPVLLINKNINGIESIVKNNSQFFFFVLPSVLKEILFYFKYVENVQFKEESENDWVNEWREYFKYVSTNPEILKELDSNFAEGCESFIDDFGNIYKEKWQEFNKIYNEIGYDD